MGLKEVVIVTGLSGSGKRSVTKAFEDLGFFCVDNLPIQLLPKLLELSSATGGDISRLALVIDVREGEFLENFPDYYEGFKDSNSFKASILFLEASDDTLVKRFSETRRPHPLATDRPILEGIALEREKLEEIRGMADLVVDTTGLTVHELRRYIYDHFSHENLEVPVISVVSFGYKFGIPSDSDLLFDVRYLPNPNFVPDLKSKQGGDPSVVAYMKQFPETEEIIQRITELLEYLIPKYIREGKTYLTISIGCTGGRHRSVVVAEEVHKNLAAGGYKIRMYHRDIRQKA